MRPTAALKKEVTEPIINGPKISLIHLRIHPSYLHSWFYFIVSDWMQFIAFNY